MWHYLFVREKEGKRVFRCGGSGLEKGGWDETTPRLCGEEGGKKSPFQRKKEKRGLPLPGGTVDGGERPITIRGTMSSSFHRRKGKKGKKDRA